MLTSSAKNKGRALQKYVRDRLYDHSPQLSEGDIRSTSMGAGGVDIQLSPAAKELYPFSIECKNVEKLNVWKAFDQANDNLLDDTIPVLVMKKNGKAPLIVMDFDDFMKFVYGECL